MLPDYSIIHRWYGNLVPNDFKGLLAFTVMSNELTKDIAPTPIKLDSKEQTAYMMNGICYLPTVYYTPEFYREQLLIIDESKYIESAISLINGSQIHEALHHKLLGKHATMDTILRAVGHTHTNNNEYQKGIFKDCFNIVEDMFNDYYGQVKHANVYPFLELLSETFFNENVFIQLESSFFQNKTASGLLGVLASFKNIKLLESNTAFKDIHPEFVDILIRARNVKLNLNQRFNLAIELWELLKEMFPEETENSSQYEASELIDKTCFKIIPTLIKDFEGLEQIEHEFNIQSNIESIPEIHIKFIDVSSKGKGSNIPYDNKFIGFSQYLLNARAERQVYQHPRITGNKILDKQLPYYQTNEGKIFGKRDTTRLEKSAPQIIFGIDTSGSMETRISWLNNDETRLIDKVLSVSKTIYRDLKENNIPCAFYGHTTKGNEGLVFGIASNQMPLMSKQIVTTVDYESRFDSVNNIYYDETSDGFSINFIAKRFIPDRQGQRVLIMMSDGQPSFVEYGYVGDKSKKHTASCIENLRKSNIIVLVLSLTEIAYRENNKIYGVKHNIKAYGENLQNNLKKIIEMLVI